MSERRRILVIDDNPEIHRDFRKVLSADDDSSTTLDAAEAVLFGSPTERPRTADFAVDCALQGQEGLLMVQRALAEGRPYAAAFVDMRMPPGWDGLETIVRLMPADPRLQLVICTAFSDYSWQQLAQRLGTPDRLLILKKPFDPIEIMQLAHALAAKWELAQRAEGERGRLETAVTQRTAELALANSVLNSSVLELRTTVAQLGRSEARFRGVVESAAAAIVIVDGGGAIWLWNPGAERLFGWSAEEAVGRRIGGMVPGLAPLPAPGLGGLLELAGTARDGRRLELEISLSRWNSDDGEFACCIIQDIGPRKRSEAAIIQARDAAEVAASARSDFLAVVSHELRTPMNGILGMTDLLLETPLDGEQREFAHTVRTCANSLLDQINEILDFSRIEAGRMDLQNIDFDPRSAAEDVLQLLAPLARGKGLDLILAVDAAVPWLVDGDPTRFKQIITNLAGNAVKFTARGSVTVALRPREDVPDVLLLEVVDTGIGIASEAQASLFEPFMQVEPPGTRRHGGTGLGLAICRRLAGLMGGRIGLDSAPGRGSRFWCELPLPARPEPIDPSSATDLVGVRVLHVDASATGREAMASLLAGGGIVCDGADGPEAALALVAAAQEPYAVAVVECRSGRGEALTLATRLRDADGPPTLLLVRDARPGLGAEARAAGAAGLLVHPIARGQLHEALRVIRSGGHVGTGMLTRHSLAERRRRRRPWVLLAAADAADSHQALLRLERLGCRVDLCRSGELAEACSRRAYDLLLADFSAADAPDPAILHARLPTGHASILLAWSGSGGSAPLGIDGVVTRPLAPVAFEATIIRHLPALDRHREERTDGLDPVRSAIDPARLGDQAETRLAEFARSLPAMVSAVMLAIARGDADGVRNAAGALRVLCLESGALPLAALAEEFERLGEASDLPGCSQTASELHGALRHALAALEAFRS
jgi:signal transduction histidine kinase/DNA-binding NarL/FixJ family response regulator